MRRQLPAWRAAGASPQVLQWIREGARCEWLHGPPPPYNRGVSLANPGDLTPQQSQWLEQELVRCTATGAFEHAPADERTHICRAHLVPKKTPPGQPQKWRLVIDLRPTNRYCRPRSCRYETLKALQRMARRGDWMFSFDLQDGYHHVGVAREHRRYMTFALPPAPGSPPGSPLRYFRCAALPFGWGASPLIFTKVMRVMVRLLRSPMAPTLERIRRATQSGRRVVLRLARDAGRPRPSIYGMRMLPYVDDFLCLARTRREALQCRHRVERVLENLGISRHPGKGVWEPAQRLEHLGLDVDTADGLFRVPPAKLQGLMAQARDLMALATREARLVSARRLASFVGYAQSVYLACPPARFYLRELHTVLASRSTWDSNVRLSRQALRDLRWWRQIATANVARAIWRPPTDRTLHCDASRLAWGGVLDGTVPAQGFWKGRDRGRHINYLELAAVHHTLARFLEELRGASVLLWEDNMTIVHVLTNRTTRSPELMHLLRRVWYLVDCAGIHLAVRHIASEKNTLADMLSRGAPMDELMLRSSVWREFESRWGPHSVDRYATASNARLPRFNTFLPGGGGEGVGALAQQWRGENNYVFPPVTELPRIAQLLYEQPSAAATVVAPYWPTQAWFQQLSELATVVEVRALSDLARPPPQLHASARHALSGATLTIFRVPGRLGI